MKKDQLNMLTGEILDSCITVHRELGPGLLEKVYATCLQRELELRHIMAEVDVSLPVIYKSRPAGLRFVLDLLVEDEIVVEVKAVKEVLPVHEAQIISYLKLADKQLGILVNFHVPVLKNGFKRYVNNF